MLFIVAELAMAFSVGACGGFWAFIVSKRRVHRNSNRLTMGLIRGYDVRFKTSNVVISHAACQSTIFGNCVDELDYIIDAHEKHCPVLGSK